MKTNQRHIIISIRNDIDPSNIYSNGISQNIIFFCDLFKLLGHKVTLLVSTQRKAKTISFGSNKKYSILTIDEIIQKKVRIDLLLEVGAIITYDIKQKIIRQGGKLLHVLLGNQLIMDMESILYDSGESAGFRHLYKDMKNCWIIPQHIHQKSYIEVLSDAVVDICPCIWEPDFVDHTVKSNLSFRVKPNIYVMEANISVVKNSLIPVTIIEALFRKNPDSFDKAFIVNGIKMSEHNYFLKNIVSNLHSCNASLIKDKVFFSPRSKFSSIFKHYDVLLSHHWKNPLNYLSFEALYFNIPFVHNSELMQEVGYYYPEFDVHLGALALEDALLNFKNNFNQHVTSNKAYLDTVSIHNTDVQKKYKELLEQALN